MGPRPEEFGARGDHPPLAGLCQNTVISAALKGGIRKRLKVRRRFVPGGIHAKHPHKSAGKPQGVIFIGKRRGLQGIAQGGEIFALQGIAERALMFPRRKAQVHRAVRQGGALLAGKNAPLHGQGRKDPAPGFIPGQGKQIKVALVIAPAETG